MAGATSGRAKLTWIGRFQGWHAAWTGRAVLDPVLLLALALAAGGALALAPPATAAAAVLVAALLRRAGASWALLALAAAVLIAGGVRARGRLTEAQAEHARAIAAFTPPKRCVLRGAVVSSPVVRRERGGDPAEKGDARVDLAITSGSCGEEALARMRVRLYGAPEDLARGDVVAVVADLAPVHLFADEGAPSPWPAIARSGVAASGGVSDVELLTRGWSIAALVDRARARVRRRIEATFHAEAVPLARALVLGEADLDPDDDAAFRGSGLAHLLAVSGTHLVVAVVSLVAALRALLVRTRLAARLDVGRIAAALAIPLVWLYADFAGGGGSATRAAAMLTVALGARAMGLRPSARRALGWSVAGGALWDPLVACDVSFALSAAATAGLLVLSRPIARAIVRGPRPLKAPLTAVAATLAAVIPCAPLLAALGPSLPALGVAANVVAAPLGELAALPLCLAHAVLWWTPSVERGAAVVGSGALLAVRAVARITAAAPGKAPVPPPTELELAALAVGAAAVLLARRGRERLGGVVATGLVLGGLEFAAIREGSPRGVLRVTSLDVGQGDATLVDLPDGSAMLVDGGGFVGSPVDPGTRVILPLLRARRRARLDLVVLTHPHPDHFGGLVTALPRLDVGELWDSGQGEAEGAGARYASLLEGLRARGVPVRRPEELCGHPRDVGGAVIEVLAPCPGFDPNRGANDNSIVLRIRYGEHAALLVGDAERSEEGALLARVRDDLRADLLKIGHHGSHTSSSAAFVDAVAPSVAVVSTGVRNRFGHPHPDTLAAFAARGITTLRTDRGGEIVWETDGHSVEVSRPAAREQGWARLLRPGG